ncbi:MAG: PAS domain-containing protein [Pseudomonadota bacterium]
MDWTFNEPGRGRTKMTQSPGQRRLGMKHPGTVALYEYWSALRAGRPAPYKAEITANGVGRSLAANTFILENLGAGNLRFRLAGSMLYDIFGLEVRGMNITAMMVDADRARLRTMIEMALDGPSIAIMQGSVVSSDGDAHEIEMVFAPLKNDFDHMDRVLGAAHIFGSDHLAAAPRRCAIRSTRITEIEPGPGPSAEATTALPGFAEEAAAFDHGGADRLTAIDGDGITTSAPRRGHLRVIDGDVSGD